jgi:hypothetical protein
MGPRIWVFEVEGVGKCKNPLDNCLDFVQCQRNFVQSSKIFIFQDTALYSKSIGFCPKVCPMDIGYNHWIPVFFFISDFITLVCVRSCWCWQMFEGCSLEFTGDSEEVSVLPLCWSV